MLTAYRLRAAELLATKGRAVVLALLVVGVAATGVAGYAYAQQDAETRTFTERTHVQTVALAVNDSARVTTNDTLWPAGTRLRNHPVYLVDAMPNLTVTARTTVPSHSSVTVRQRVTLVIRATAGDAPLWSTTVPVTRRNATVTDGRVTTRTTVSVPALRDRLRRIRERIAVPVSLAVRLRVESRYDTGRYAGVLATSAPLSVTADTYAVGAFHRAKRTHAKQVTRRRDVPTPGLPRTTAVGGLLAVVAFAGAGAAAAVRPRLADPDEIRYRLERARLADWITAGQVPKDAGDTTVDVDELSALVDVAIDCNSRVVHDEWRGVYAVIDGDTVYEYDDPDAAWDTATPHE